MVDLHAHTDRSDGTLSPRRLVDLARGVKLSALAITDHDTIAGYDYVADYATEIDFDLICGVELSTMLAGESVHILGYFFDGADKAFRDYVTGLKESRRDRNRRLAERLRELGLEIDLADAEALGAEQTGRPHFARLLVKKGYVAGYREAFDQYLDDEAPGFVDRKEPSVEQALAAISASGGLSSWAHPWRFFVRTGRDPGKTFDELQRLGLAGVEAHHRDHDERQTKILKNTAVELGLAVTGGSDYHGPTSGGVDLGDVNISDDDLASLRQRSQTLTA